MSKIHLVIPDCHAHYEHNNNRATYLSRLISDLRPDVVVNLGDSADFPSLSGYDQGKRSFMGRTYNADVVAHLDFQERLWEPVRRRKKKMPRCVFLEGNHEHRIEKCLDLSPELENTVSFKDLDLERYYGDVVRYKGNYPGNITLDGINYSHFSLTGVSGRPIGGEHSAFQLLSKKFKSCTVGHSHTLDFCHRVDADGKQIIGLVSGWFGDYPPEWAGELSDLWWSGVIVKRNVQDGYYDPQFISLKALEKEYGSL